MNKEELVEFLKENLRLKVNYAFSNTSIPYIEFRLVLNEETIDYDYIYTRPENRELQTCINMYVAYKKYNMEDQAEAVKQKILSMLNAENQKEFKKIISDNKKDIQ